MTSILRVCSACSLLGVSLTALPAYAESSKPTAAEAQPTKPEVTTPQAIQVSQVEVKKVETSVAKPPVSTRMPLSSRIFSAPTMQQ